MNKQAPLPAREKTGGRTSDSCKYRCGWKEGGGGTRVVDVKPFSGFAFNKVAVDDVLHHMVAALQKNGAS